MDCELARVHNRLVGRAVDRAALRQARDKLPEARRRLATRDVARPAPSHLEDVEAFLDGMRHAYERLYLPAGGECYPLADVRLGPDFLASARAVHGLDDERILESHS